MAIRNFLAALVVLGAWLLAPEPAAALTFDEVCAQSTTVNCWGFESEDDLHYAYTNRGANCRNDSFLRNHPNGDNQFGHDRQSRGNIIVVDWNQGSRCYYPKRDSTYSTSGNHSLKFILPTNTGDQTSGDFTPVFGSTGSPGNMRFVRFGRGGEFWVRYRVRETGLTIPIRATDAPRTVGGVKRLIIHGYSSSESLEETLHDPNQIHVMGMYSDSGSEWYGLQDTLGCWDTGTNPAQYSEPPCRKFKSDIWRTMQIHVRVADNASLNNGLVELYVDDEPNPIIRVTNANHSGLTQMEPYTETAIWSENSNGYGKLSFTLFTTRKDPSFAHPEGYMWIDDVVVSRVRVPKLEDKAGTGDAVAPNPPSNLNAN